MLGGGSEALVESCLSHFAAGGPCVSHGPFLGLGVRIHPEPTPGIGTDVKESKVWEVKPEALSHLAVSPGPEVWACRFPCCLAPW